MWLNDFIFGTKEDSAALTTTTTSPPTTSVEDIMAATDELEDRIDEINDKFAKITADIESLKHTEVVRVQGGGRRRTRRRRTIKNKRRTK